MTSQFSTDVTMSSIVERESSIAPQFDRPMCNPTLHTLPPPPPGKTGWPWTVETPALPPVRETAHLGQR